MPRTARIVVPNVPHHITQRGNNRQDVFFVDDDRRVYLSILKAQSEKQGLEILGWCLMTNHIHLIGRPSGEKSLAKALGRTRFTGDFLLEANLVAGELARGIGKSPV